MADEVKVTPEAPVAQPAPAPEPTPQPVLPAPEPSKDVEDAEQAGWDKANKEAYPAKEKKAEALDPAKPADETPKVDEAKPSEPVVSEPLDVRQAQRQYAEEFATVKNEVKEQLLKEAPVELKDKDGDPVRTVEDVMNLVDPRTGEGFTQEAATAFLMQVRQELQERATNIEQNADRIANIQLTIKDEAERMMKKYSDFFKANPEIQKQLWADYSKTLKVSGNLITEMPVSLAQYYDSVLQPHLKVSEAQKEAADAKAKLDEVQKKQSQVDRSDIVGNGKVEVLDEEEKGWEKARKELYGKQ